MNIIIKLGKVAKCKKKKKKCTDTTFLQTDTSILICVLADTEYWYLIDLVSIKVQFIIIIIILAVVRMNTKIFNGGCSKPKIHTFCW